MIRPKCVLERHTTAYGRGGGEGWFRHPPGGGGVGACPPLFVSIASWHRKNWYLGGGFEKREIGTSFKIFQKIQIENETFRLHKKQSKTNKRERESDIKLHEAYSNNLFFPFESVEESNDPGIFL